MFFQNPTGYEKYGRSNIEFRLLYLILLKIQSQTRYPCHLRNDLIRPIGHGNSLRNEFFTSYRLQDSFRAPNSPGAYLPRKKRSTRHM